MWFTEEVQKSCKFENNISMVRFLESRSKSIFIILFYSKNIFLPFLKFNSKFAVNTPHCTTSIEPRSHNGALQSSSQQLPAALAGLHVYSEDLMDSEVVKRLDVYFLFVLTLNLYLLPELLFMGASWDAVARKLSRWSLCDLRLHDMTLAMFEPFTRSTFAAALRTEIKAIINVFYEHICIFKHSNGISCNWERLSGNIKRPFSLRKSPRLASAQRSRGDGG